MAILADKIIYYVVVNYLKLSTAITSSVHFMFTTQYEVQ